MSSTPGEVNRFLGGDHQTLHLYPNQSFLWVSRWALMIDTVRIEVTKTSPMQSSILGDSRSLARWLAFLRCGV